MHRRRTLAVGLAAATVLLLLWVELIGPFPGDRPIVHWALRHRGHGELWDLAQLFQVLGTPLIAVLTIGALAVLVGRRLGREAAVFLVAAGAVPLVTTLLKALIGPTPPWQDLKNGDSANFPSGHVAYAVALFGAVAWLAEGRHRRDVRVICIAVAVAMGPARLMIGAHLLSDVLAGACVGGAWLIGVKQLLGSRTANPGRTQGATVPTLDSTQDRAGASHAHR
jgi:membrane-associated phospholipid phosphatase